MYLRPVRHPQAFCMSFVRIETRPIEIPVTAIHRQGIRACSCEFRGAFVIKLKGAVPLNVPSSDSLADRKISRSRASPLQRVKSVSLQVAAGKIRSAISEPIGSQKSMPWSTNTVPPDSALRTIVATASSTLAP